MARLNLNFKLSRYLKKATKNRREEDAVLAEDEDPAAHASVPVSRRSSYRADSVAQTYMAVS